MSVMQYKGYLGSVEYDDDDRVFHGRVINVRDTINYEGTSVDELHADFEGAVDAYLKFCAKRGDEPEKPFSGKLNLRLSPALHRKAVIAAMKVGESLNTYIVEAVEERVRRTA